MATINELSQEAPLVRSSPASREFDILDVALVLAARKYTILLTTVAGFVIAILLVLMVDPKYTAKTVILPPQQDQSSASTLLGQFSALSSMTGLGSSLGIKNPTDLYLGILASESVTDALVKRFDIIRLYHPKRLSDARLLILKDAKFVANKDGTISISVTNKDPKRAAAIANAYVEELYKLNNRLALGGASQRRLFYEQQLAQEKDNLADSEVALKETEEKTGVIAPTGQTEAMIQQVARLQAEMTEREVQLDSLRTSSTEQNPDVIRLSTELSGLRAQLRDLESSNAKHAPGDISIPTAGVPQASLEYIRKERDVKYHQFLFDLLARQYEAARIDEAKAAPVIQVIDPALVPDRKSSPYRALWALVGFTLGLFFSTAWVLGSHIYRRMEADEEQGRRLELLKQELKLRG
ncbi:MAG: Wzz/FepE/Etk N-terminal domain-containing protein [Acidobacteriaceae bacterium]